MGANTGKKINSAGLDIIKHFEGCRLTAYLCPAGVWSIGFGHTGPEVVEGLVWTQEQCDAQLVADMASYEKYVAKYVTTAINENRFSACVSLCYNIGPGRFRQSSVCKNINDLRMKSAASAFLLWIRAKGEILRGLQLRREAEKKLFETAPPIRRIA